MVPLLTDYSIFWFSTFVLHCFWTWAAWWKKGGYTPLRVCITSNGLKLIWWFWNLLNSLSSPTHLLTGRKETFQNYVSLAAMLGCSWDVFLVFRSPPGPVWKSLWNPQVPNTTYMDKSTYCIAKAFTKSLTL